MDKVINWITASAGSGKTTFIVNSICSLIESGTNPESILALSFTNSASNELSIRTKKHELNGSPKFCTIHSFAASNSKLKICSPAEQEVIIEEAIEICLKTLKNIPHIDWSNFSPIIKSAINSKYELNFNPKPVFNQHSKPSRLPDKIIQELANLDLHKLIEALEPQEYSKYLDNLFDKSFKIRKDLLNPKLKKHPYLEKIVINAAEYISLYVKEEMNTNFINECKELNMFIGEIVKIYQEIMTERGLSDYSDILNLDPVNPESYAHIRHIFIDEAQDVSARQWNFLINVIQDIFQHSKCSLTMVGDEKQLIYSFNGSSVSLYKKIKSDLEKLCITHHAQWNTRQLNINYRSGADIISFVDQCMNSSLYIHKHTPGTNKRSLVKVFEKVISTDNVSQSRNIQIQICIKEINRLLSTKLLNSPTLTQPSDISIIIPKRGLSSYLLAHEIIMNDIPISETPFLISSNGMFDEFFLAAEFSISKSDFALISILKGPYFRWTNEQLEDLCSTKDEGAWNRLQAGFKDVADEIGEWLLWPKITMSFYSKLFFDSSYGMLMIEKMHSEVVNFLETILCNDMQDMHLLVFLNSIREGISGFYTGDPNGISIMTIHAAKGRENNIVFFYNSHINPTGIERSFVRYDDLIIPKSDTPFCKMIQAKQKIHDLEESKRLNYVALTRAREQLYILPPVNQEVSINSVYYAAINMYKNCKSKENIFKISTNKV